MIDTVHVKFHKEIPKEALYRPWLRRTHEQTDGTEKEWFINHTEHNGAWIRRTNRPYDYSGNPLLFGEITSLPRVVSGNNYTMLHDVEGAISIVNNLNANITGMEDLDIGDGTLHRVDFCYNYQIGDNVTDYISAIQWNYPFMKRPYPLRYQRIRIRKRRPHHLGDHHYEKL